jgi:uncharacterized protein
MTSLFRRLALAATVLVTSLASTAPASPEVAASADRQVIVSTAKPARPAMWAVRDADTTIYLFGTVHALPPGVDWLNGSVAAAFEGSQELVTEITETDPAGMQAAVVAKAMLPAGKSLRAMLTPQQRAAFEATLTTQGLPAAAFDRFKPWYAAVALSTLPILRQGHASENGVEQMLDARAKASKRPHSALETPEFQLGLFDSLPQEVQLRYLNEVVADLPTAIDELGQIVEAWKAGDAENLARLMNEEEDAPELMELLLRSRNRTWAEWIKTRMDKPGTVFLAVGAGHLAGDGSVQQVLAAKGIASTRIQ